MERDNIKIIRNHHTLWEPCKLLQTEFNQHKDKADQKRYANTLWQAMINPDSFNRNHYIGGSDMKKNFINLTIKLEEDTVKKLEAAAENSDVNVSEYIGDLIDSSVPQKRVYGKRTRERQETIYRQKLNDIINNIDPEQRDLRQKLIELQEYGRELLWHV